MRVIAGAAKGHRLASPSGRDTRPTSDRVREALFSTLAAEVVDATVCDLFAGSGALGIEALSRGAAHATFVERAPGAVASIEDNLARTGLGARATVRRVDVARFCRDPSGGPFDLVLVDPPYREPLDRVYRLLGALHAAGGLAAAATVVVERDRNDPASAAQPPGGQESGSAAQPPDWLALAARRSYGDTVLLIFRA